MIVKNFRAGAAGAGFAHGPEIIITRDAQDLAVGKASDLLPKPERLVIVDIHGDQQPVLRQRKVFGNQRPGQFDRPLLEVIAEGEITEHLKERVMTRGVAYVVEIVVLAAGTYALLCGDGAGIRPLLQAGEDILELHHPRIGKHQGGIITRNER